MAARDLGAELDIEGSGLTSLQMRLALLDELRVMGIKDEAVLQAMRDTPRHLFIDKGLEAHSYKNTALPIGMRQTISQPYIVAKMSELLRVPLASGKRPNKVLEVGSGSGYQSAVLAKLCHQVYSIERIPGLHRQAVKLLDRLGVSNLHLLCGDGYLGLAEHAPFDAILITAATVEPPAELLTQLAENARLIAPLGAQGRQRLSVLERAQGGDLSMNEYEDVAFVPMVHGMASAR